MKTNVEQVNRILKGCGIEINYNIKKEITTCGNSGSYTGILPNRTRALFCFRLCKECQARLSQKISDMKDELEFLEKTVKGFNVYAQENSVRTNIPKSKKGEYTSYYLKRYLEDRISDLKQAIESGEKE